MGTGLDHRLPLEIDMGPFSQIFPSSENFLKNALLAACNKCLRYEPRLNGNKSKGGVREFASFILVMSAA